MTAASADPRVTPRATVARHGRQQTSGPLGTALRLLAIAVVVVLASTLSIVAIAVGQISGNVETVKLAGPAVEVPPGIGAIEGGFTMLIVGSDECVETGGCPDRTEKLNDFTMVLHVNADNDGAVALTIPRDLIVPIPSCPREDGSGSYSSMTAQQINVSYSYGGLPCTALTVEALTGLDIEFAAVMNFSGVEQLTTALGGVDVCINAPIRDSRSGLDLPSAGVWPLEGKQALQFLRTRYSVGDGSDTGRIGSQQAFLASMMRKIRSAETLSNPATVYRLATVASQNMLVSDNLKNVATLASLALTMKDIPLEKIVFVKYPAGADSDNPNRVVPMTTEAELLMAKIAADEAIVPEAGALGTTTDPNAVPTPTATPDPTATGAPASAPAIEGATGQTAADQTCTAAFGTG